MKKGRHNIRNECWLLWCNSKRSSTFSHLRTCIKLMFLLMFSNKQEIDECLDIHLNEMLILCFCAHDCDYPLMNIISVQFHFLLNLLTVLVACPGTNGKLCTSNTVWLHPRQVHSCWKFNESRGHGSALIAGSHSLFSSSLPLLLFTTVSMVTHSTTNQR